MTRSYVEIELCTRRSTYEHGNKKKLFVCMADVLLAIHEQMFSVVGNSPILMPVLNL